MQEVASEIATQAANSPEQAPRKSFEVERERLRALLAQQIEADAFRDARETAVELLCLCPGDEDARRARDFIEQQLAAADSVTVEECARFSGHGSSVNAVAFAASGRVAASGSGGVPDGHGRVEEQSIRVWDIPGRRQLRCIEGFPGAVTSLTFAPAGDRLVTAHRGGGLYLWDLATGQPVRRFERRAANLYATDLSSCGRWLLSGGDDRLVRFWDVHSGLRIHKLSGHTSTVTAVAFSPDNRRALSGAADGTARLWDLRTGREVTQLPGQVPVLAVACSPAGQTGLAGTRDGAVVWWDLESGRVLARLMGHAGRVQAVAFCPDGARAVSAGADGSVRLWDLAAARELRCFTGHRGPVEAIAVSPGPTAQVLSGGRDATVRLWPLPGPMAHSSSPEILEGLHHVAWASGPELAQALARLPLLTAPQKEELISLRQRLREPTQLLLNLAERGWLTPYQVSRIAEGSPENLVLGRYVILDRLGEGATGDVFKACPILTRQPVVLKVLRPDMTANAEAARQFVAEMEVLAQLDHPHVIRTYGAGVDRGRHFIAMEHLEGTDLAKLVLRTGALPVGQACEYIRQAALGLEHAHEHCLIHRDIKPANLLLTVPGARGPKAVIKIIDWGLAALRPPGHSGARSTGASEELVGTADYIAPEQAADGAAASIQADIYALGCTLYHLLAGQPPFPGGSLFQKLMRHREAEPRSLREIRRDVPDSLLAVVRKMTAKKPAERYSTPAAVAGALAVFSFLGG